MDKHRFGQYLGSVSSLQFCYSTLLLLNSCWLFLAEVRHSNFVIYGNSGCSLLEFVSFHPFDFIVSDIGMSPFVSNTFHNAFCKLQFNADHFHRSYYLTDDSQLMENSFFRARQGEK